MTFRGYKVHVILITCALIIIVGFGAQRFVYGRHVTASIENTFKQLEGVEAVQLHRRSHRTDIELLVDSVADFQLIYKEAQRIAQDRLGEKTGEIVVVDSRTPALAELYDRIHFAIHEAAVTGRFTQMQAYVDDVLSGCSLDKYKVSVDEYAIFVELHDGDDHLYERIPRMVPSAGAVQVTGGTNR